MSNRGSKRSSWMRMAGMGMELGAAVAGLTLFGVWIDRVYDSSPKGLLIGAALGMIGGLYNLVRASMRMVRDQPAVHEVKEDGAEKSGHGSTGGGPE